LTVVHIPIDSGTTKPVTAQALAVEIAWNVEWRRLDWSSCINLRMTALGPSYIETTVAMTIVELSWDDVNIKRMGRVAGEGIHVEASCRVTLNPNPSTFLSQKQIEKTVLRGVLMPSKADRVKTFFPPAFGCTPSHLFDMDGAPKFQSIVLAILKDMGIRTRCLK
jgi:hypothetical protein